MQSLRERELRGVIVVTESHCRISTWGHVVATFSAAEGDQVTRLSILGSDITYQSNQS